MATFNFLHDSSHEQLVQTYNSFINDFSTTPESTRDPKLQARWRLLTNEIDSRLRRASWAIGIVYDPFDAGTEYTIAARLGERAHDPWEDPKKGVVFKDDKWLRDNHRTYSEITSLDICDTKITRYLANNSRIYVGWVVRRGQVVPLQTAPDTYQAVPVLAGKVKGMRGTEADVETTKLYVYYPQETLLERLDIPVHRSDTIDALKDMYVRLQKIKMRVGA